MSGIPSPATSHVARSKRPADTAIKRLDGIGRVLADLDVSRLQSQEQTMRALWTLDAADKCIRAIMGEFRTEPATEQMVRTSERLVRLIELARDEVIGLHRGNEAPS
jgi:hypothetical protein